MREKYVELKLQANFFKVAPAWLVADAHNFTNNSQIADTDAITVTALTSSPTAFYVIRHSDFTSMDTTLYKLRLPTSMGNVTLPQLGGSLSLNGRDSKIMTTDFAAGDADIVYSTAEIFTWQKYGDKTVLVLYAGPNETNEVAIRTACEVCILEGALDQSKADGGVQLIQWKTQPERTVVSIGNVDIYLMGALLPNSTHDHRLTGDRSLHGLQLLGLGA